MDDVKCRSKTTFHKTTPDLKHPFTQRFLFHLYLRSSYEKNLYNLPMKIIHQQAGETEENAILHSELSNIKVPLCLLWHPKQVNRNEYTAHAWVFCNITQAFSMHVCSKTSLKILSSLMSLHYKSFVYRIMLKTSVNTVIPFHFQCISLMLSDCRHCPTCGRNPRGANTSKWFMKKPKKTAVKKK